MGRRDAEKDVPRAFALAVLTVIAVAPEYAVDALYAREAGSAILIGLGWSGVAFYAVYRATRTGDQAVLEREGFLADAVEIPTT